MVNVTSAVVGASVSGAITALGSAFGFTWRLSSRLTHIEDKLETILTNHLPHLEAAVRRANRRNPVERKPRRKR